jgi:uncharacterized protein YodC (DUF2158 family)
MLKINNQKMTVEGKATEANGNGVTIIEDRYVCVWFYRVKEQKAVFHKDALELFPPYFDSMHFANYE